MSRIDELAAIAVGDLLASAGATSRGRRWGPCPACASDDQRGAVGVDGQRWHCYHCSAGGDAVSLVAVLATGKAKPDRWGDVYAWAEREGWLQPADRSRPRQVVSTTVELHGTARHVAAPLPLPSAPAGVEGYEAEWIAATLAEAQREAVGVADFDAALDYVRDRMWAELEIDPEPPDPLAVAVVALLPLAEEREVGALVLDLLAEATRRRLATLPPSRSVVVDRAVAARYALRGAA